MEKNSHHEERVGILFVFLQMLLYATFPIIINYSTKILPPLFFAAISTLTGAVYLFFHMLVRKKLKEIFIKEAFKYILGVTVFIIIIPSILIYSGTKMTSGVNTSLLLQTELLFSLIFCWLFFHEKITMPKIIAGLLISCGTFLILYKGSESINLGDILIICGSALYPFGNFFAKRALEKSTPLAITFLRSLMGGAVLFIISLSTETIPAIPLLTSKKVLLLILGNGIFIMAISKILWYEGLKRLEINKATTFGMSSPALSLIFAVTFLKEKINPYQLLGLLPILVGVYLTIKKQPLPKSKKNCQSSIT